jgi:hypothetical protein
MRHVPDSPAFSRHQAHACGWTDPALARAVRAKRLHRVRRGWFAASEQSPGDSRVTALAASRACTGSVISHASAAAWHGLPLLRPPDRPAVTVPPRRTGDLAGAHLHRATLDAVDLVEVDGVLVTSVARTLIDLARAGATAAAVVPIDAALQRRMTTLAELDDVLQRCWNWPGIRRAVRAVSLADGRAESVLESISRLVLGWLRWPAATLQQRIGGPNGQFLGRLDFYWDDLGIGGEADGAAKYRDDPNALYDEKRRQDGLEAAGLIIVRWGWRDVVQHPRTLAARLESAADRAAWLKRSGSPRDWSLLPSRTDY